jgi:hypothetical protein
LRALGAAPATESIQAGSIAVVEMCRSRRFVWNFAFGFGAAGMTPISAPRVRGSYTAMEALNKSILDFPAPAIGKAWFSDGSQDRQLGAADLGSASLRCEKR